MKEKLVILGSGLAGLTAAIYAARANLNPLVIAGTPWGGQLMITTDVDNYPGFPEGIQGPELMENVKKQAERFKVRIINDDAIDADLTKKPYKIKINNDIISTETIIIATGASARWLNIPSEIKYRGFGVSACATCDGFFYKNKDVLVVGGGNTAVEEALFLTNFASKVTLIHRRDTLRAEKILQDKLIKNKKINIVWNHTLHKVLGEESPLFVTKALIKNTKTEKISEINVDGIFIAIGHDPNTKLFSNQIKMDKDNYLLTENDSTKTNIPGVFAAGDVQDKIYRQAVTAAGQGCMAALEAEKFLSLNNKSL